MPNRTMLTISALTLAAALATPLAAQQPAVVPEQMPFDIPYGEPIGLDQAKQVADAAQAEAKKHNWKMAITVVGPAGDLIYFARMDGTAIASAEVAQGKARTAATARRPTKVFQDAVNGGALGILSLPGVVSGEGGLPLIQGGKVIGGIGCAGGAPTQDSATCKVGADTIK